MEALPLRLENLKGFTAEGDVLGVDEAIASGRGVSIVNGLDWPVPPELGALSASNPTVRIGITDELISIVEGVALLRPPSLVLGVAGGDAMSRAEIEGHITDTLAAAGLSRSAVASVATTGASAGPEALAVLGFEVETFEQLSGREHPSEAAALRIVGSGGRIVVAERLWGDLAIAVARRRRPVEVDITEPSRVLHG